MEFMKGKVINPLDDIATIFKSLGDMPIPPVCQRLKFNLAAGPRKTGPHAYDNSNLCFLWMGNSVFLRRTHRPHYVLQYPP